MKVLVFLLSLLWAVPAFSLGEWRDLCNGTGNIVTALSTNKLGCFHFETNGIGNSNVLLINANSGLFCFNPRDDTESDTGATATVFIRACRENQSTADDNACFRVTDLELTGLYGDPFTQRACWRGPGLGWRYYIEIITEGLAGENPYVSVQGEP